MVQPGSATVMSAASSARAVAGPVPAWPGAGSAMAVTGSREPGPCGAATVTATSATATCPGPGTATLAGSWVLTPGPCTRTVARSGPLPSPVRVTRISCRGRPAGPVNKSVDATAVIRMASSSHGPGKSGKSNYSLRY